MASWQCNTRLPLVVFALAIPILNRDLLVNVTMARVASRGHPIEGTSRVRVVGTGTLAAPER